MAYDSDTRIEISKTYLVIDFGANASVDTAQSASNPLPIVSFILFYSQTVYYSFQTNRFGVGVCMTTDQAQKWIIGDFGST